MKKLVITLLALVAIVTAVNAQGMSEEQREKTLYNLIVRMRPVGTQYAITTTPVTYKEYATIKSHSALGYDTLKDISIMPDLAIGAGVCRNQRYEGCKSYKDAGREYG